MYSSVKMLLTMNRRNNFIMELYHFTFVFVLSVLLLAEFGKAAVNEDRSTVPPRLLLANRRNICLIDLTTKPVNKSAVITNLNDAAVVDFLYEENLIFWTDLAEETVYSANLVHDQSKQNIRAIGYAGMQTPDGLACDWVTRKLYWIDSYAKRLEVTELDGSWRKVLYWDNLDQPRAIALDPSTGYMYWTDWGNRPRIDRGSMDGLTLAVPIIDSEIRYPNSLTIDYEERRIYWIDGSMNYIGSCNMDGSQRKWVIKGLELHSFALTLFGNVVYWSEWNNRTVEACNKTLINGSVNDRWRVADNLHSPMYMHVYHPSRQPKVHNPCAENNGGCSHLCLLSTSPSHRTCACPIGIRLLPDNKTCTDGPDEILLLARRPDIRWYSLDAPDFTDVVINVDGVKQGIAVDFDPIEGYVYFTDGEARTIRRVLLNSSNEQTIFDHTHLSSPDGIAVDWLARNLYWVDAGLQRIEVSTLDGRFRKVLVAEGLKYPRAIVLDLIDSRMYWSDWGDEAKIERAGLDGSGREVIVGSPHIKWPNSLAVDHEEGLLYWADARLDKLESCKLDGSDRKLLISVNLPHVFGLSLLGDYLYWTDWQDRTIERVNKHNMADRRRLVETLPDVMGLKVIGLNASKVTYLEQQHRNPCMKNNGDCTHLCLRRPDVSGPVCACPMDLELMSDGKSCIVPNTFLIYSIHQKLSSIRRIPLDVNNNDAIIPLHGVDFAKSLDFDFVESFVYWIDVEHQTINRAFINGSSEEQVIKFGLQSAEDIAVDWIGRNLYWVDSRSRRIEMSRLDGSSRRVLVWGDIVPIAIALDPIRGYMYWSNWVSGGNDSQPRLERSNLDGTGRITLCSSSAVGLVTSLSIDLESQNLYWADSTRHSIEYFMLKNWDGRRALCTKPQWRKQFLTNLGPGSLALSLYRENVYWMNNSTGTIQRANVRNATNRSVLRDNVQGIQDLVLFDASRQPGTNACSSSNCSNICIFHSATYNVSLLSAEALDQTCSCSSLERIKDGGSTCSCSHHCVCPHHQSLATSKESSKFTCKPPDATLLVSRSSAISQLSLSDLHFPESVLPLDDLRHLRAIQFDPVYQIVYWIDDRTSSIRAANLSGHEQSQLVGPTEMREVRPFDLSIDPYSRVVYWSDELRNTITATHINGTPIGDVITRGRPRYLALDAEAGLIFWTDDDVVKLNRALVDGMSEVALFSTQLYSIGSIALDRTTRKVYWTDPDRKVIECGDYDGANRRVVTRVYGYPAGLEIFGGKLYYLDSDHDLLIVLNVSTEREIDRVELIRRNAWRKGQASKIHIKQRKVRASGYGVNERLSEHDEIRNRRDVGRNGDIDEWYRRKRTFSSDMHSRYLGLTVAVHKPIDRLSHPCGSHDCSHICVPMPGDFVEPGSMYRTGKTDRRQKAEVKKYHCSCPHGLILGEDYKTCLRNVECSEDTFACGPTPGATNEVCVPNSFRCDSNPDCSDGSDELNCTRCEKGMFLCAGRDESQCLPVKVRCDGVVNCPDKSDEKNCPPCDPGYYVCEKQCVTITDLCLNKTECRDREDICKFNIETSSYPHRYPHESTTPTIAPYAIIICVLIGVGIVIALLVLVMYMYRHKTLGVVAGHGSIILVAQPPMEGSKCSDVENKYRSISEVQLSVNCPRSVTASSGRRMNSCAEDDCASELLLYERDPITGASSSEASCHHTNDMEVCINEPLNPPPTPESSAAMIKRHRRKKRVRRHPTTPCSTDVCEESCGSPPSFHTPSGGRRRRDAATKSKSSHPYRSRARKLPVNCDYHPELFPMCPPPSAAEGSTGAPPSPATERSFAFYPPPPPSSAKSGYNSSS